MVRVFFRFDVTWLLRWFWIKHGQQINSNFLKFFKHFLWVPDWLRKDRGRRAEAEECRVYFRLIDRKELNKYYM